MSLSKSIGDILKNCFYYPPDFKTYLSNKNFASIKFIFMAVFFNGICLFLGADSIFPNGQYHYKHSLYLFAFLIISVLIYLLLHKLKANGTVKQLFCHSILIVTAILNIIPVFYTDNIVYELLTVGTILVVACMSLQIHPFAFTIATSISFAFVITRGFRTGVVFSWDNYSPNILLISITLCIMSFYRRSSSIRHFEMTEILKKRTNNLEHEVMKTTLELLNQNNKIIKMQDDTIVSLSNLVENRDSDTGEHVRRTRAYVVLIAEHAQKEGIYPETIDKHFIELLAKSAPMHDIGKIVVPDSILKKPGKLTPEEFEEIKKHTTEGGKIVRDVLGTNQDEEYIKIASEVAEGHHEKWNGEGYPKSLKGMEIPLSARIMAIADVFDALSAPRCYKKSMPIEEALTIIKDSAGTHFDPVLAKLFVEQKNEIQSIMNQYNL